MAARKKPTTSETKVLTHREYLAERANKLKALFADVGASKKNTTKFYENPNEIAAAHGLRFSEEEVTVIGHLRDKDFAVVADSLINPGSIVAVFDNNCGCGVGGAGW